MLNKFLVSGRMTADPEIKTIGENRLCEFTIACERPKRKGEETAETDFFPCRRCTPPLRNVLSGQAE